MSFGQFLKAERKKRGMSQRLLAQLIDTSNTEISRIEQEIRQKPSPVMLKKISEVMNIPLDTLMKEAGYTPQSTSVMLRKQEAQQFNDLISSHTKRSGWNTLEEYSSVLDSYNYKWDYAASNESATGLWVFNYVFLMEDQKATYNIVQIQSLITGLGIATTDKKIQKLSFVFNNPDLFESCKNIIPERLDVDISIILISLEKNTVIQECFLSK